MYGVYKGSSGKDQSWCSDLERKMVVWLVLVSSIRFYPRPSRRQVPQVTQRCGFGHFGWQPDTNSHWPLTVSVNLKLGYSLSIFTGILSYLSDTTLRQFWNSHIIISATLSKYTEHAQNYFAQYLGPWAWKHGKKMFKSRNLKALVTTMSRIVIRGILLLKSKKIWIMYQWSVWYKSNTVHKLDNTVR